MDILQEWFESSDELQFCGDVQEELSSLDHNGRPDGVTQALSLLPSTSSAPPTEVSVSSSLLRSQSLNEIHHLTTSQAQLQLPSELPNLPSQRSEVYRCQSALPALNSSTADTSHVEIALEMPRYLLQEDEALAEETSVEETSSPIIPYQASLPPTATHSLHVGERQHTVRPSGIQGKPNSLLHKRSQMHNTATKHSKSRLADDDDDAQKMNLEIASDALTPPPSFTGGQLLSLNATPINVAPVTGKVPEYNSFCGKKKRCHGGGWPKGKSRKIDDKLSPPKPPSTGYAIFLSEKRGLVQEQHGVTSMAVVSKLLGQMWSQLSPQAKEAYYCRAEEDKGRYISEMRTYLAQSHKDVSASDLQRMDSVLSTSIATENDDQVFCCQICHISFTSLNNKRSHFSGRLHRQALIEQLHQMLASTSNTVAQATNSLSGFHKQRVEESRDISEQLRHVATQHKENSVQLAEVRQYHDTLIKMYVKFQQELCELEYIEASESQVVRSLLALGNSTQVAVDHLTKTLTNLAWCTADSETAIPLTYDQQPSQCPPMGKGFSSPC